MLNVSISNTVIKLVQTCTVMPFIDAPYSLSNGTITNVVLHDLDLFFMNLDFEGESNAHDWWSVWNFNTQLISIVNVDRC